jgi:predicted transcriptional regulator
VDDKLDEIDIKLLKYFKTLGPDYAKLLATRFNMDITVMRDRLEHLESIQFIERVEGRIVKYYHRRMKSVKHRNHTYYMISREGDHFLREQDHVPDIVWKKPRR